MDKNRKKRARQLVVLGQFAALLVVLAAVVWIGATVIRVTSDRAPNRKPNQNIANQGNSGSDSAGNLPDSVETFASQHNLSAKDYPESILELLDRNPETRDFVLNYPLEHGKKHSIDMSEFENSEKAPLFMQWDRRWGYLDYGSDVVGITGCGPVTLAMAGYYLTGEEQFRPDRVVEFALANGYCVPGSGSSWTLISEGAAKLGLDVTEIPLDENRMAVNLRMGNPIVCAMGPGDFTTSGHYILLTGVEDGKFCVNDANSRENSKKLWSYEEIESQIKNLWVLRKL